MSKYSSPVTVTKYVNGVAQSTKVVNLKESGYILVTQDGYGGSPSRVVFRSSTLSSVVARWFDQGGEGGNYWVYHTDGSALTAKELNSARVQLSEMA
jgi:hypothetical protein